MRNWSTHYWTKTVIPEWLWSIIVGVVVVGLVAALRSSDTRRLADLEKRVSDSAPDVLREKVRRLEQDYQTMHLWKNSVLPMEMRQGYSNAHSVMGRIERELKHRIERIEKFLNGHLK